MERENTTEHGQTRVLDNAPPHSGSLERQREEIDGLFEVADALFDSIDNLHAEEYLEQNEQPGGQ